MSERKELLELILICSQQLESFKNVELTKKEVELVSNIREELTKLACPEDVILDLWNEWMKQPKSIHIRRPLNSEDIESIKKQMKSNLENTSFIMDGQFDNVIMEYTNRIQDNLKVVDHLKIVKGKYGHYHISNDGVRFSSDLKLVNDDIAYETKDEVLHAKTNMVNDINKDIMILEEKLESLKRDRDTVIDKYLEFERVFDM